jgi:Zn-dependent M28 family amino/carboxypeptidase
LLIAFAGEEAGLLGSQYFTRNPKVPLANISFLVNVDIMGSGEEGITVVNGSLHKEAFDRLTHINDSLALLPQIKIRGKAANSDHYPFSEKGVPAFFFYTMGPNKHYHDIEDTYDALSFSAFNNLQLLIQGFFNQF